MMCRQCDTEFDNSTYIKPGRKPIYCSSECRTTALKAAKKKRDELRNSRPKKLILCKSQDCDIELYVSDPRQQYCSSDCRNNQNRINKLIDVGECRHEGCTNKSAAFNQKYCSDECRQSQFNLNQRNRYKKCVTEQDETVEEVEALLTKSKAKLRVFRYRCRTCAQPITKEKNMVPSTTESGEPVHYCDNKCESIKLTDEIMTREPTTGLGSPFSITRKRTEDSEYRSHSIFK
jgi:hypothetical protein